jgi:hypothetical protein
MFFDIISLTDLSSSIISGMRARRKNDVLNFLASRKRNAVTKEPTIDKIVPKFCSQIGK